MYTPRYPMHPPIADEEYNALIRQAIQSGQMKVPAYNPNANESFHYKTTPDYVPELMTNSAGVMPDTKMQDLLGTDFNIAPPTVQGPGISMADMAAPPTMGVDLGAAAAPAAAASAASVMPLLSVGSFLMNKAQPQETPMPQVAPMPLQRPQAASLQQLLALYRGGRTRR